MNDQVTSSMGLRTLQDRYRQNDHFFDDLVAARGQHEIVAEALVRPFSGKGLRVAAGQILRIGLEEGPQIGDVAFWSAVDPAESFSATRTWSIEGWFLTPYKRLWSDGRWCRPLATWLGDTLDSRNPAPTFHHHHVASHCSPEFVEMTVGKSGMNACRLNLLQGAEELGLSERDLHSNIDIFQKFSLDPATGRFHLAQSEGRAGDFVEVYAEVDLLVSVSVCPMGDGTNDWMTPSSALVRPLRVTVYETHQIRPLFQAPFVD